MQGTNVALRTTVGAASVSSLGHCSSIACIVLLGGGFFAGAAVVGRLDGKAQLYASIAAVVALVIIFGLIGFWATRAAQTAVRAPERPRGVSGEIGDGRSKGALSQAFGQSATPVWLLLDLAGKILFILINANLLLRVDGTVVGTLAL